MPSDDVLSSPATERLMRIVNLLQLATLFSLAATPALAQRSDEEWMENCRDHRARRLDTHCEVKVFQLTARSSLSVDAGQNGGIEVMSWDRNDIEVHARIQAHGESDSEARRRAQDIEIETEGSVLRADGPSMGRGNGWSVSYLVMVPERMDITASSHNGPISVSDVTGTMNLDVVNGPLMLEGLGGHVSARAENGPLFVSLKGSRWQGTGLDAETRNGPVTLEIPEGYSAQLETGTVNGPLDVSFPLTVTLQGRYPKLLRTTLGDGGPPVKVVTTNGPASIERN
jgi:DUF4097 and DUF4098 domain-containing protein YvlB